MTAAPSGAGRWLRGISSIGTSFALLAGVPYLLIMLTNSLIREPLPDWEQVGRVLGQPSTEPIWLIAALVIVGWISWAVFAVSFAAELISALRGTARKAVPALSPRGAARSLIAGIALLIPISTPAASFALEPEAVISQVVAASPAGSSSAATPASSREAASTQRPHTGSERSHYERYVVEKGDSLWQIAEDELDDGQRFSEIYRASRSLSQPDGKQLTNPSHIEPGWHLRIPDDDPRSPVSRHRSSEPDPAHSSSPDALAGPTDGSPGSPSRSDRSEPRPATPPDHARTGPIQEPGRTPSTDEPAERSDNERRPAVPTADSNGAGPDEAASPEAAEAASVTDTPDPLAIEEVTPTDSSWPLRTATGVGALLAAGLLAGLAGRRIQQRRSRRPGQLLPLVPEAELDQEVSLGEISDPLSMRQVDAALRSMARHFRNNRSALPVVRHARLSQHQFELFLAEPANLPVPWSGTSDLLIWTLDVLDTSEPDGDTRDIGAPYPALVTVGHLTVRGHESHLLLDLNHVAALGVCGDPEIVAQIVRALSLELATSIWADDLQLTAIGMLADFEVAMGTGRVQHVDAPQPTLSQLEQRHQRPAHDDESRDDPPDPDGAAAQPVEPWAPEIVVTRDALSAPDRELLGRCLSRQPRAPLAAITAHDALGDWYLEQDPADDRMATLQPLGLRIEPQRVTEDAYRQILATFARAGESATATGAEAAATPEPSLAALPDGPKELQGGVSDLADPTGQPDLEVADPTDDPDTQHSAGTSPQPQSAPVLRLLGRPDVVAATGPVEETKRTRCLEIASYLALFPDHTSADFTAALWPGGDPAESQGPRAALVSRTRRWLGADPSGQYWLRQDADSGYRLRDEVTTDWDQLQRLLPEGPFTATDAELAAALRLIRGRPFDGVPARRYGWATVLQEQMLPLLTDICYESGARLLTAGHWGPAAESAERGLSVDRLYEPLWRILILAELRENGTEAASARADELQDLLDRYDLDMETQTVDLLADIQAGTSEAELDASASK